MSDKSEDYRAGYVDGLLYAVAVLREQKTIGITNPADELPWHQRYWIRWLEAKIGSVKREVTRG